MAYVYCPGGVFSRYVDLPWRTVPDTPTAQQLLDAEVFLEVSTPEPPYDPATQNLVQIAPVEGPPGTWTQTWQVDAKTVPEQEAYAEQQRRQAAATAIKSDAEVEQLLKATPAQINNWVDTNVTDLPNARDALKRLARAVSVIGAEIFDA